MTTRSGRLTGPLAGVAAASLAGTAGTVAGSVLRSARPGLLDRSAHVGRRVTLAGGPVCAVALLAALPAGAPAALPAVLAAAVAGLVDDLAGTGSTAGGAVTGSIAGGAVTGSPAGGGEPVTRGLAGHLGALRSGRLTTGAGKVLAIGCGSLVSAALLRRGRAAPGALAVLADGALIAGTANLVNLLDLRPGRAGKAAGAAAAALLAVAPAGGPRQVPAGGRRPTDPGSVAALGAVLGALAAELPRDLAGEWMLGDCGANALGAAVGAAVVAGRGAAFRTGWLAVVLLLTAASERVSFSAVIAGSPALSWLDRLGTPAARRSARPAGAPA